MEAIHEYVEGNIFNFVFECNKFTYCESIKFNVWTVKVSEILLDF